MEVDADKEDGNWVSIEAGAGEFGGQKGDGSDDMKASIIEALSSGVPLQKFMVGNL